MTPASLTPSTRLPPGEFNLIPDTGRPELVAPLMMSLSRPALPSAISPLRRTIVLFSRERVVVRSAAHTGRHAATTHANANTLLVTAVTTLNLPRPDNYTCWPVLTIAHNAPRGSVAARTHL